MDVLAFLCFKNYRRCCQRQKISTCGTTYKNFAGAVSTSLSTHGQQGMFARGSDPAASECQAVARWRCAQMPGARALYAQSFTNATSFCLYLSGFVQETLQQARRRSPRKWRKSELSSECTHGKVVMITGAGGSIGSELFRQDRNPRAAGWFFATIRRMRS
jgi:hypothetical protein